MNWLTLFAGKSVLFGKDTLTASKLTRRSSVPKMVSKTLITAGSDRTPHVNFWSESISPKCNAHAVSQPIQCFLPPMILTSCGAP